VFLLRKAVDVQNITAVTSIFLLRIC